MTYLLECLIGWTFKPGKVDPMVHIGRYRVRCGSCGRLYASASRADRCCRMCRFLIEERLTG